MSSVINIPEQMLDQYAFPNVQSSGVRYVRASRAIKAIQVTSNVTFRIPVDGELPREFKISAGMFLCRIIDTDDYFAMENDLFQLLFELPT